MAQDQASRRLTLILSASLAAVIALGIWIAVLIGRAQPDSDPPAPTSETSALETSENLTGGEMPEDDGSDEQQTSAGETTAGETAPAPESTATASAKPSTETVTASISPDDDSSDDVEPPPTPGGGVASDPTVAEQTAP